MSYLGTTQTAQRATLTDAIGERILVELTDDEKASTNADDLAQSIIDNSEIADRIDRARDHADAIVDGFVRKQHATANLKTAVNSGPPPLLQMIATNIAVWWLHARRRSTLEVPPDVKDAKKDAIALLKEIALGNVTLGVEPVPPKSAQIVAEADGPVRKFTEDTLADF